ncbi:hypothetical protein TMatcc_000010 [Talaromyces marneffei ATCC 18224]
MLTNSSRWHVCLHYVHIFNTLSFITTYFPIPFFAVLFFAYKFWNKSKMTNYADIDFITGSSMDIPEEVTLKHCGRK